MITRESSWTNCLSTIMFRTYQHYNISFANVFTRFSFRNAWNNNSWKLLFSLFRALEIREARKISSRILTDVVLHVVGNLVCETLFAYEANELGAQSENCFSSQLIHGFSISLQSTTQSCSVCLLLSRVIKVLITFFQFIKLNWLCSTKVRWIDLFVQLFLLL